jgi:hypothetical protein
MRHPVETAGEDVGRARASTGNPAWATCQPHKLSGEQDRLDAFTALLGKCLADILRDAHAAGAAATPLLEEVLDQFHAKAWAGVCHWLPRIGNPTRGGSWLHPS